MGTSERISVRRDKVNTRTRRFVRLIRREAAEHYLLLTLLSFAASVSLTRLFLSLAGYPQIGGGTLHIAHVLWGGLLLYVAALLPLLFANRGVYTAAALLAGAGIGLFIDEVGKFITQSNDYFFPISSSIIYVLFLLTIVLFLQIRRVARAQARDELTRDFEEIWEALHHALSPKEYKRLREKLETAAKSAPSARHADLASALLTFLQTDEDELSPKEEDERRRPNRARRTMARILSHDRLRVYLIVGLSAIGLLSLKNPFVILAGPFLPEFTGWLASLHVGREVGASAAPQWFAVRLGLELAVGFLLLAAACLLAAKRRRIGITAGYFGLLLSLSTVNILLFYFEQFSTIITTGIQFAMLVGLLIYGRHAR